MNLAPLTPRSRHQAPMSPMLDEARNDLIESYERLARHLVRGVGHWSLDRDDLYQSAMIGVIEAVDTFDASRGIPIAAHVINRIKYAICGDVVRARRHTQTPPRRFDEPPSDDVVAELWDAIDQLPPRDAAILIGFYGLNGRKQLRAELAEKHRQTTHQISASTTRSMKTLRVALTT